MGLFILTIIFLANFIKLGDVHALIDQFYEESEIGDLWIIREEPNGITHWEKARVIRRRSDNMFAYCVEPFVALLENTDMIGNALNINEETWERVELLSYYGYMYGNHTDIKWYSITQMMIWRTVNPSGKFYYTHGANGAKWDDRFVAEMNEIEQLIAQHYVSPNFNGNKFQAVIGQELRLTDSNSVLDNYKVLSNNNISTKKDGNQLVIIPNTVGEVRIILQKKDELLLTPPLLYGSPDGQDVMIRGSYDPLDYPITLNVLGGKVELHKLDSDKKVNIASGEATLRGAQYGIYKESGEKVSTITTGENGYVLSEYLPCLGRFYLQEEIASNGYTLDKNKYYFTLSDTNLLASVNAYEKVIEREIELTKVYASDETGIMIPEVGIQFGFYNNKGEEIVIKQTDKNGRIKLVLPYGTYTVKQLNTTLGHEKIEDFNIEVKSSGETFYYTISNAPIKAKLKILKIDKDTQKVIIRKGLKFKIKNLDTNEYVKQTITYPTPQTIEIFETDENGILITPYALINGRYQIEELENQKLDGYLWNSEPLIFEIGENSHFINDEQYGILLQVEFANQQVKGEINVNKVGEKVVIENGKFRYEEIELDGVYYELYANEDIYSQDGTFIHKKNDLVKSFYTKNGFYQVTGLYLGKYCLIEKTSVGNHIVDNSKYCFELEYKDQYTETITYTLNLKNYLKKGTFEFTKKDLITGKPLPDTKIQIFDATNDKLIFEGITDENGQIIIKNMYIGSFYLIESEAPDGYILNEEKMYFQIKENGDIVKAAMTNEKIMGKLVFTKTDEAGIPLAGVSIKLFKSDGTLIGSYITNSDGIVIIENLEYGDYFIQEVATIDGYELSNEKILFSIMEQGAEANISMVNKKLPYTNMNNYLNYFAIVFIVIGLLLFIVVKKRK